MLIILAVNVLAVLAVPSSSYTVSKSDSYNLYSVKILKVYSEVYTVRAYPLSALFEVDARWRPVKPIGKGAYGVVCSARREGTEEVSAIKKVGSAFDNVVDAKRILREIKLLRHLRHENIISIREILRPACRRSFEDVYIVYELMDTDLHQIIRSSQPLSDDHVQYFVYQLLRGLKYIHSGSNQIN